MASKLSLASRVALRYGHEMPIFGLGTWQSKPGAVETALRLGYRHIDSAEVYGNQSEVAEDVERSIKAGHLTREELWVTSKLWLTDFRQERVRPAIQKILKDLRLEYVDQILVHWPVALRPSPTGEMFAKNEKGHYDTDVDVDITKTWKELEKLVDEGWIKTLGLSNFNEQEVLDIIKNTKVLPSVNQVECHPYLPQNELKTFLASQNIAMVGFCPLANADKDALVDADVVAVAKECGKTAAQVILRWNLQRGVIIIPKSSSPTRIAENANIFDFELSEEQMERIDGLVKKRTFRLWNPGFRANDTPVFASP